MASNLLIVESPSKAKTLKKYLGKDYEILASYGHVRDLVPKTGAVDPDDNFKMKYELIDRNMKHVDAIQGGQGCRYRPARDRPGPRRRGDRVAPGRDPQVEEGAEGQDAQAGRLLRNHRRRGEG